MSAPLANSRSTITRFSRSDLLKRSVLVGLADSCRRLSCYQALCQRGIGHACGQCRMPARSYGSVVVVPLRPLRAPGAASAEGLDVQRVATAQRVVGREHALVW